MTLELSEETLHPRNVGQIVMRRKSTTEEGLNNQS
jgi:hypothetical protein